MPQKVSPVAERYGMLRPIEYKWGKGWICICDCGATTTVTGGNLRSGNTVSCGCRRRENARNNIRIAIERNDERTARGELWGVFRINAQGGKCEPHAPFMLTRHKRRRKGTPCWVCRRPTRGMLCEKCSGSPKREVVGKHE